MIKIRHDVRSSEMRTRHVQKRGLASIAASQGTLSVSARSSRESRIPVRTIAIRKVLAWVAQATGEPTEDTV
jgi:hypothetical protein